MSKKSIVMDSPEELAAYRVKRLKRQDELMQKMTTRPLDSDLDALFRNYASLLTVSSLVGFSANLQPINVEDRKEPLGESVQRQFFTADQLKIIDLISYSHTHEPLIIRSKKKFDIFSGYAAVGFDYLSERLGAKNRDWTDPSTVIECGKLLAMWYLKGSGSFSSLSDLADFSE